MTNVELNGPKLNYADQPNDSRIATALSTVRRQVRCPVRTWTDKRVRSLPSDPWRDPIEHDRVITHPSTNRPICQVHENHVGGGRGPMGSAATKKCLRPTTMIYTRSNVINVYRRDEWTGVQLFRRGTSTPMATLREKPRSLISFRSHRRLRSMLSVACRHPRIWTTSLVSICEFFSLFRFRKITFILFA